MLETLSSRSERQGPGRSRRGVVVLLVFLILLAGVAVGVGVFYNLATSASGPRTKVVVTIPHGASGTEVANILKANGVIRSAFMFRLLVRVRGLSGSFLAGQYNLTTNMSVSQVLDAFKKGPFLASIRVTFPEGLTISQVAAIAEAKLGISQAAFVKAAKSGTYSLPPYLPAGTKSVEGFLSPNTYDFFTGASADDVVKKLLGQFAAQAKPLPWGNAKGLGVTDYQVVIIASMIEREARFEADRPLVAAVIYNRLKRGMPLQIDATVLYALGKNKPKLTLADLKIVSPYNTYLHAGLPPGPIASPGLAALEAALVPSKATYLYYVSDANGHNHYASTYAEFLTLKAKYTG